MVYSKFHIRIRSIIKLVLFASAHLAIRPPVSFPFVRTPTRTYGEYRICYVYSTFSTGVSHEAIGLSN
jgi:hypothetical protein